MSDHDDPTEPFAPVTAEVVRADEPDASGEPEAPDEPPREPSLFGAVNARRVSIALVVIALAWLGVWAYTSGSAATGSPGTSAAAAPATSTPARAGQGHHKKDKGATTTLAPPNVAHTPQAYATAFIEDWGRHDRKDARRLASPNAFSHLFARRLLANEQLTAKGCQPAGAFTNCTWTTVKRQIVIQVQNPSGSTPLLVVAVTISRV